MLLVPCALLLAACNVLPEQQTDRVRYFTLSGPAASAAVNNAARLRPVLMAGHLRNRSVAVRISDNEVVYLDDARWAEPLEEALTQVLRNRLAAVGGGAVVTVQILRCEPVRSEGNAIQLAATYTVAPAEGPAHSGSFAASPRTWDGRDHGALVGLLRDAAAELAEAVAVAAQAR